MKSYSQVQKEVVEALVFNASHESQTEALLDIIKSLIKNIDLVIKDVDKACQNSSLQALEDMEIKSEDWKKKPPKEEIDEFIQKAEERVVINAMVRSIKAGERRY